ncbi:serine hydrolase [Bradyrhizobium lablabi]|uniref:serine hydrolase n=1 Tax=Bradyrhizobium lablabi TaxID=722472 RepID=UPI001BACD18A|nr:serine hydrolase [Bradyrhizobium lablabi]MBR1125031.1 serine hydrolase [Bradyrhizobium lablabi]
MLRTTWASSRVLRLCVLGLATATSAIIFTTDSADARRYRRHVRHQEARASYSPAFASIIVDANSGATLQSNNPDALRRPASLTKIMTLYLLFERLEAGKMTLDTQMDVSEHASEQAPTKLGLKPGQTLRVEDAIKGLVTRSANDAAVVIAEAIGGDEESFAKLMTRKARALGMSKTTYRNASGLPDDEQLTTARDQATLGRAIQDRFPRYYRYFATSVFVYRGHSIRNHNRLLGNVEGVDGIKTGYTRASGFNLVTSMRRGNRHLVGVVMGGRSGGSRDATMRNLLAENLEKASAKRTVAAISERNPAEANTEVAEADTSRSQATVQVQGTAQAAAEPGIDAMQQTRSAAPAKPSIMAAAAAALPPLPAKPQAKAETAKPEPAPLTSGVIQTQQIAAIPGSAEPMKPVRVKTVQVKAGPMKLAAAGPSQTTPSVTHAIPPARGDVAETSNAVVAKAEVAKPEQPARIEPARTELPPQPPGHGTGQGVLGVLPASSVAPAPSQAMAYADPQKAQAVQQNAALKPAAAAAPAPAPTVRSGWIIQVGALESEGEARSRIEAARSHSKGLLNKADPFTEPVVAKDNRKLFRARFAGLERDQAEAVCRTLKRADIPCITARN